MCFDFSHVRKKSPHVSLLKEKKRLEMFYKKEDEIIRMRDSLLKNMYSLLSKSAKRAIIAFNVNVEAIVISLLDTQRDRRRLNEIHRVVNKF